MKTDDLAKRGSGIPGTLTILERIAPLIKQHYLLLAGYSAWCMIPAFVTFFGSFASENIQGFLESLALIADLSLTAWVTGALTIIGHAALTKEPLPSEEVISSKTQEHYVPALQGFLLTTLLIPIGLLLLILPGIAIMLLTIFFIPVIYLEQGHTWKTALLRSKDIVMQAPFSFAMSMLGMTLLTGTAYIVLVGISGILLTYGLHVPFLSLLQEAEQPAWLSLLLNALFIPLMPFSAFFVTALYEEVKNR